MKQKFFMLVATLVLLTSTQFVSAEELRKIIKEERIESQYGVIGDFFGIGDRLYRVTYEGGVQERVWKKSGSLLSKATITELPLGLTINEGQTANYTFKAQAPNLPRFTGGTGFAQHRFRIYDDTESQQVLAAEIIDSQIPVATSKQIGFIIPGTLPAGKRFYFIKEDVKDRTTGIWVSGVDSQSSEGRFEIDITPKAVTPVQTKTILVDTIPTNATITYLNSPIGVTAKDFVLETGQTKILVFSQAGYVTVMKGLSFYSTIPFIITMNKVAVVVPAVEPIPATTVPGTTPKPTVSETNLSLKEQAPSSGSSSGGTGAGTKASSQPIAETTANPQDIANAFRSSVSGINDSQASNPQPLTGNKIIYNIGLAGIILVVISVIGYVAYTNMYVQKGKQKKKMTKSLKNKGGKMWYE
ncbi:MAG: hypothetical protein PHW62_00630 [Candidatus Ratteibacteria bacterium]|nr:hypothetical protein [Candidatus Ratteibacteria bacterium]